MVIISGFFLQKKTALLTDSTSDYFTKDTVSFVFSFIYFSLILHITFSYINLLFLRRKGEKTKVISRLLKLTAFAVLLLFFGEKFYLSSSGIITFGSVSGIIIGIGSKAVLSNFFSGIMLYFDKPFKIGDYVVSPQLKIAGTVSETGMRITTIINDDNQPIYIPNSLFSTLLIENTSRTDSKRILLDLFVSGGNADGTDDFIRSICGEMKSNPLISDGTEICRIDGIAQNTLHIIVSCFVDKNNTEHFDGIKNTLILKIMTLVNEKKITLYSNNNEYKQ